MRLTLSGGPRDGQIVDVPVPAPGDPLEIAVLDDEQLDAIREGRDHGRDDEPVRIGVYVGRGIGGVWTWQGWRS